LDDTRPERGFGVRVSYRSNGMAGTADQGNQVMRLRRSADGVSTDHGRGVRSA